MRQHSEPFSRKTLDGHITASAWVVNDNMTEAFLIRHKSLDLWMQPGGHVDPDEYPAEAAVRESNEETGLSGLQILPPGLFDVDVHSIPDNLMKNEPRHTHYDLRYLVRADHQEGHVDQEECIDGRWFDLQALSKDRTMIPSLRRMASLTLVYADSQV